MSAKEKLSFKILENHPADSRVKICEDNIFQTLSSRMGTGGGNVPMVMESKEPILLESNQNHATIQTNGISTSLPAAMGEGGGYIPMIVNEPTVYRGDSITSPTNASNPMPGDACHTLIDDSRNYLVGADMETVVRRLTPMECERLQGYPDHWTDIGEWTDTNGKKHKDADSPRYKALGNSIALPFWQWMAERMVKVLKDEGVENPTMASLFDGISGFCLVYKRCGCEPKWSSEVEEFCIAVCKRHFGDEDEGLEGDLEKFL